MSLPAYNIQDFELYVAPVIIGRVNDPLAVRRPVRRGVILLAVRQLECGPGGRIHLPDGPLHSDGQPLAVRRPGGPPWRTSRSWRQVVVVHVCLTMLRRRIGGCPSTRRCQEEQKQQITESSVHDEAPQGAV